MIMPIEIAYLDNGTGILFIGKGTVTGRDILEAKAKTFSSEGKIMQYQYGLLDFSRTDGVEISNTELEKVTELDKKAAAIIPDRVVAIVAGKDVIFGLSRMWEAYMGGAGWETHVYRSRKEAETWIKARVKEKFGIEPTLV
jgi:hypothetical protein